MRDIDFDELDRAVNNYLDKKTTKKSGDRAQTPAREPRKMVFSRRAVVDAGSFHRGSVGASSKNVEKVAEKPVEKIIEKPAEKAVKIEAPAENKNIAPSADKKERAHEPDFSKYLKGSEDKVLGEISARHTSRVGVFENFEIRDPKVAGDIEFERQEAEKYAEKRDAFSENLEPKNARYEAPVLVAEADEVKADARKEEKTEEKPVEIRKPEPKKTRPDAHIVVPSRGGVRRIEDEEKLTVFSGEKAEPEIAPEIVEEVKASKIDEDIFSVSVKKASEADESQKIETVKIENSESEKKADAPMKIGIKLADDEVEAPAPKNLEAPRPVENAAPRGFALSKKPKADKIITRKTSGQDMSDIKTPFVQNPKINKRPLGAEAANIMSGFEMKKGLDRQKKIRQAKAENRIPQTPILARDDFATPAVPRKQKSGWGVVIGILLITALISIGVGLAVYWFTLS